MKTLYLIRHAKSDWAAIGTSDYERPLNERGKKNAPEMAKRLHKKGFKLSNIICSPAQRTKETAKAFVKEFDLSNDKVRYDESLYLPPMPVIEKVISKINDAHNHVAIITHNDGITNYANILTPVRVDNIPTCGIYAVQANVKTWKEFKAAVKTFLFFDYPKKAEE